MTKKRVWVIIFSMVNIIFLFIYFFGGYNFTEYLFLHFLNSLLFFYFINQYYEKNFLFLFIIVPFYGGIIFLLNELILFEEDKNILNDYEKYIRFSDEIEELEDVDILKEINAMNFLDRLKTTSEDKKKEVLINFLIENSDIKVSILKEALNDSDQEVAHYASSTLNLMEQQYENIIDSLKGEYSYSRNYSVLLELEKIFYNYIKSGLLEGTILNYYYEEYMKILNKILQKDADKLDFLIKKLEVLIFLKEYEKAFMLAKFISKKYNDKRVYIFLMKLNYSRGNISSVISIAKYLKNNFDSIDEKYKSIINFWDER